MCTAHRLPIIPHGTGTGLEGGTTALVGGVAVNVARNMEQLEIHQQDFAASVRPGVTRESLNQVSDLFVYVIG